MFTFIGGFALAALAFLLAQLGYVKAIYDNFYAERVLPEPGVDNEEEISKKLADARVELDSTIIDPGLNRWVLVLRGFLAEAQRRPPTYLCATQTRLLKLFARLALYLAPSWWAAGRTSRPRSNTYPSLLDIRVKPGADVETCRWFNATYVALQTTNQGVRSSGTKLMEDLKPSLNQILRKFFAHCDFTAWEVGPFVAFIEKVQVMSKSPEMQDSVLMMKIKATGNVTVGATATAMSGEEVSFAINLRGLSLRALIRLPGNKDDSFSLAVMERPSLDITVDCVQGTAGIDSRDVATLITDAINKAVESKIVLPNERHFTFGVVDGLQLHPNVLGKGVTGPMGFAPEIPISALSHVTEEFRPPPNTKTVYCELCGESIWRGAIQCTTCTIIIHSKCLQRFQVPCVDAATQYGMVAAKTDGHVTLSVLLVGAYNCVTKSLTAVPYCLLGVRDQQRESKKSMGSTNPVWRQSLEFQYPWDAFPQILRLSMFDWELVGKNDFMGRSVIDLSHLRINEPETSVYALHPRDHKESAGGTVELTLTLSFDINNSRMVAIRAESDTISGMSSFTDTPSGPQKVNLMYISRVIRMSDCAKGFCERQREALDAMRALNDDVLKHVVEFEGFRHHRPIIDRLNDVMFVVNEMLLTMDSHGQLCHKSLLEGHPLAVWPMEGGYVRPFGAISNYIQALTEYTTVAMPLVESVWRLVRKPSVFSTSASISPMTNTSVVLVDLLARLEGNVPAPDGQPFNVWVALLHPYMRILGLVIEVTHFADTASRSMETERSLNLALQYLHAAIPEPGSHTQFGKVAEKLAELLLETLPRPARSVPYGCGNNELMKTGLQMVHMGYLLVIASQAERHHAIGYLLDNAFVLLSNQAAGTGPPQVLHGPFSLPALHASTLTPDIDSPLHGMKGLVVVEVTTPPTVLLLKAPSDFDATVWVFQLNQQSQYAVVSRTQERTQGRSLMKITPNMTKLFFSRTPAATKRHGSILGSGMSQTGRTVLTRDDVIEELALEGPESAPAVGTAASAVESDLITPEASSVSVPPLADSRVGGMQGLPYIKLSRFISHFGPDDPKEKLLGVFHTVQRPKDKEGKLYLSTHRVCFRIRKLYFFSDKTSYVVIHLSDIANVEVLVDGIRLSLQNHSIYVFGDMRMADIGRFESLISKVWHPSR